MAKGQLKSDKSIGVDMTETNSLLKTMISLLQTPGVINMDGQKVGEVLAAAQRNVE